MGYLNQHKGLYLGELVGSFLRDFYANISAELTSIAITVLIIDAIYQKRDIEREKRDLMLQMGSPDNAFATEAVRRLRAQGWLEDGTLRHAYLCRADLRGVYLSKADLSKADLSEANLSGANLSEANLSNADLYWTNLSNVDLSGANLSKANLFRANLRGADLHRANLLEAKVAAKQLAHAKILGGVTMPDGTEKLEKGDIRKE